MSALRVSRPGGGRRSFISSLRRRQRALLDVVTLWRRLWGSLGTGRFNIAVVR